MSDIENFYNQMAIKFEAKPWVELSRNQQDIVIQAVQMILHVLHNRAI